jgi:hypothetical protein
MNGPTPLAWQYLDDGIIAKADGRMNRVTSAPNKRFSDHTDQDVNTVGYKGEVVVYRYYGRPDPDVSGLGDGGHFDIVVGGVLIEIKTTLWVGGNLLIPVEKEPGMTAQFIVLCETPAVRDPQCRIVGYIEREGRPTLLKLAGKGGYKVDTFRTDRHFLKDMIGLDAYLVAAAPA